MTEPRDTDDMSIAELQELASKPYPGGRNGWVGFAVLLVLFSASGLIGLAAITVVEPGLKAPVWGLVTIGTFGLFILVLNAVGEPRKK